MSQSSWQSEDFFKDQLEMIRAKIYELNTFDRSEEINHYCESLKSQVEASSQMAIEHIHRVKDSMFSSIDSFRRAQLDSGFSVQSDQIARNFIALMKPVDQAEIFGRQLFLANFTREFERFRILWTNNDLSDERAFRLAFAQAKDMEFMTESLRQQLRQAAFRGLFLEFVANRLLPLDLGIIGDLRSSKLEEKQINSNAPISVELKHTIPRIRKPVGLFEFLSGSAFLTCCANGQIKIWDAAQGKLVWDFKNLINPAISMSLLSEGMLATGHFDGSINLWEIRTKALVKTLRACDGPVSSMLALKDGRLASVGGDCKIYIWDVSTGQTKSLVTTLRGGHSKSIWSPLRALSNGLIVVCSSNPLRSKIEVWDYKREEMVSSISTEPGWTADMLVLANDQVVLCSMERLVKLYDIPSGAFVRTFDLDLAIGHLRALTQLPNGYVLAANTIENAQLIVWNPETGQVVQTVATGHSENLFYYRVSRDGKTMVTGSSDNTIKIFSIT